MTSTSQQGKPSTQEHIILLVSGVPTHMEWQDVKDEIKPYVLNSTVNRIEGVPGLWSIDIRSEEDADKAYRSLIQIGFCKGRVQIQVTLTDKRGIRIRPLGLSPRPLVPVTSVCPQVQTQPPSNPGQSRLIKESRPSLPPAQRNVSPPFSMNLITNSMNYITAPPKCGLRIPSASAAQQICPYNLALFGHIPCSSNASHSNSTLYPHSKKSHDRQRGQGPVVVSKDYYDSDHTDSDE